MLNGSKSLGTVKSIPISDAIKEHWVQPAEKPPFAFPPIPGHAPGQHAIRKAARRLGSGREKFLPFSIRPHFGRFVGPTFVP